ncbi:hypothetical protein GCM10011491_41440 [Brucella endophytica]|uniref:Uncharacterized protein n=2 Tax=Brucella endophytica TaxID=1963359 RepID=A0A916WLF4_9HYPH|nr:hypothetical protein GCM10011491_41440 [Brucella endophytica]
MQSFRNARDACIEWGGGKIHEVKVNEDVSLTVRPLSPEGLTCALLEDQDSIMNDAFKNGILIGGIIGFSVGLSLLGVVRFAWRSLKPNFQ